MFENFNISNLVSDCDFIYIFTHQNPDFDTICSALSFYFFIANFTSKDKIHIFNKDINKFVDYFDFIDNVSLIKPLEKFRNYKITSKTLFFFFDCSNLNRVDDDFYNYFNKSFDLKKINSFNFDHHISNEFFCKFNLVDSNFSSTCELLYYFYKNFSNFKLNKPLAKLLICGIYFDTGFFKYNFCYKTFSALKDLTFIFDKYELNSFVSKLSNKLFNLNIEDHLVLSCIFKKAIKDENKDFVIFYIDYNNIHSIEFYKLSVFTDYLSTVSDYKVKAFVKQIQPNVVKTSLRTNKNNIDLNLFANRFYNGGGHKQAAGFSCEIQNLDTFLSSLKQNLEKFLK